jgi:hypothetical protein
MIRRITRGTLWVKLVPVGLVLAGMGEKRAALITFAIALVLGARSVRDGIREQYWETPAHQAARRWEDLVWDNTRWLNHRGTLLETPDEGIKRLTEPYLRGPDHAAPVGDDLPALDVLRAPARRLAAALRLPSVGHTHRDEPALLPGPLAGLTRAPHELSIR